MNPASLVLQLDSRDYINIGVIVASMVSPVLGGITHAVLKLGHLQKEVKEIRENIKEMRKVVKIANDWD